MQMSTQRGMLKIQILQRAESTTPGYKTNISREWRHNTSYPETFFLKTPDDKIQTRSSLKNKLLLHDISNEIQKNK